VNPPAITSPHQGRDAHAGAMSAAFQRVILSRLWLTFIVLGMSFFVFCAATVNLGRLLLANKRLISEHGWQAVMDGALWQSVELMVTGYLSMSAYIVFKACEHRLTNWLGGPHG
jgi:hypothetical protein